LIPLPRRTRTAVALFVFALCLALLPSPAIAQQAAAPAYASFVCWNYPQLPKLRPWQQTENIIATTLTEAYPALQKLPREQNGSQQQLKDFLRQLPDQPGRITLVYLAAHQSPAGEWNFPDRTVADWGALSQNLPALKNPQRIVLLDCCYAAAADRFPDWTTRIAPACLYAAPADRPTPDLLVFWRRPVDWTDLFPGAALWLRQHHIDNSDERLSYFGLVWLQAWTQTPSPPRTLADWNRLAQTITQISRHASTEIRSSAISNISE